MDDEYPGNKPPETVPSMIRNVVEQNPNSVAVAFKQTPGGKTYILGNLHKSQIAK